MTLSDFATFSSAISGLAVTASLVYLALQTHQNAKHTKALIQQGRAARMTDTNLRVAEFGDLEGYMSFLAGNKITDPVAFVRFLNLFSAGMFNAEDAYFQYRDGLLDQEAFHTFRSAIGNSMRSKGYRRMWMLRRARYGSGFRAFMDDVAADSDAYSGPSLQDQWNAEATDPAKALPDQK